MTTQRRSYETGHKPKCLVIVDDTAEWDRAVYYASRWAIRVGGGVVMLRIIEIEDQNQQWLGVAEVMLAEAHEEANAALDHAARHASGIAAITPERVIREGDPTEQMIDVIEKDVDIAMLVLASNPGPEGPGPIIGAMVADYLLSGKKWSGPREGVNMAGYIAWAVGFIVGILPLDVLPITLSPEMKSYMQPAVVYSFIVGFVVYYALAKAGMLARS